MGNPICRQIPWGEGRQYDEHLAVRRGIRPTFNPKQRILNRGLKVAARGISTTSTYYETSCAQRIRRGYEEHLAVSWTRN